LGSHCSVLIYHCGEFQSIWWPPSSGPNYLGLQSSSGAHHSVEEFRSTEIERDLGDSGTWVVLTITQSTIWHLSGGDWTSLAPGPNCWGASVIQQSMASSSSEGFGTWHWSSSLIQPLEAYFVLSGAFCSSSYLLSIVYHLGHLLSIPDRHLHCSRFFYFINKKI
jgi:hypothetical protein